MGASDITFIGMVWALALLIPAFFINKWFSLGQFKPYTVSAVRMIAQLAFVGVYLHYIFEWNNPFINFLYLVAMILIAVFSSIKQTNIPVRRFLLPVVLSTFIPTIVKVLYFNYLIVGLTDLFDAKYLIPIGGMILGNSMKTNIVGLERFYGALSTNTREYLVRISFGADRNRAVHPFVKSSILAAMNPIVATMLTIGLVSLPGMMTGQILGGSMPATAIKYQIAIMAAIFCSNIVGVAMTLKLVIPRSFDSYDMPLKGIGRVSVLRK
jgi:putative ABC transport system permease protein